MHILLKNQSQPYTVAKPDVVALVFCGPCSSDRIERQTANLKDAGSSPATGITLISPTRSANCLRGLTSGEPKAELLRLTVILDRSLEESKVQSDVPQLPNRDGEGRFLRQKQNPEIQMPAVRKALR
jgi:hypothetical protein